MTKILIVDDTEGIRRMLVRQLRRLEYETLEVSGGQEALDLLKKEDVDLVLLDQMMPEMSGTETFERIKKEISNFLPVIMITAHGSLNLAITFMKDGGEDFVEKPIDIEILDTKIGQAIKTAELRKKLRNQEEALRESEAKLAERNAIIEKDLDLARSLQQSQLPNPLPEIPHIQTCARYYPFDKVGGDIYDVVTFGDTYGFFIADVSGHGVPAAFLTMLIKSFFRISCGEKTTVDETLQKLNALSFDYFPEDAFATAFYAVYEPLKGIVSYSSAGHPCALLFKGKDQKCITLEGEGFPLTMLKKGTFERREVPFEAGDKLFIYTDGLIEAKGHDGKNFGEKRLIELIEHFSKKSESHNVINDILDDSQNGVLANNGISDDITILGIEWAYG